MLPNRFLWKLLECNFWDVNGQNGFLMMSFMDIQWLLSPKQDVLEQKDHESVNVCLADGVSKMRFFIEIDNVLQDASKGNEGIDIF